MRRGLFLAVAALLGAGAVRAQIQAAAPVLIPYRLPELRDGTVDFGDLDGDGDLDLVLTGLRGDDFPRSRVYVLEDSLYTEVVGGFVTQLSFKVYRPSPIVLNHVWQGATDWGDFDGDGDDDLLIFGLTLVERVVGEFTRETSGNLFRSQNGLMVNSGLSLPGLYVGDAAWSDLDGDGDLDFAACGASRLEAPFEPRTIIYRNDGARGWQALDHGVPGLMLCSLAWGDLDGDGLPELAISGESDGGGAVTRVYRNTGTAFVDLEAELPALSLSGLDWADSNGDGREELIAVGGVLDPGLLRAEAAMLRWRGGPEVVPMPGLEAGVAGGVAWTDYDVDGDPDLVYVGAASVLGTRSGWVLLNRNGTFEREYTLAGLTLGDMTVGDYNGDGDEDLIVLGVNDEGTLFLNFFMNRTFPEPIPAGYIRR